MLALWYPSDKQELPCVVMLPSSPELMAGRGVLFQCFLSLFLEEHQLLLQIHT